MAIDKIDKNFNLRQNTSVDGAKVYEIPSECFALFGRSFRHTIDQYLDMMKTIDRVIEELEKN